MPIKIELDKRPGSYRGGDVVTGKVFMINNMEKVIHINWDLTVRFIGQAWAQWKEKLGSREDFQQRTIETYFNESHLLLQPGSCIGARTFFPGITELPFRFRLPSKLPSSFQTKYGGVSYTAHVPVPLSRKQRMADKLSADINIQGTYNLACFPGSNLPGRFSLLKRSLWGFGKVKVTFRTNKRGFLPGEELHFNLDLENDTRLHLQKIRVYLMQVTIIHSRQFNAQSYSSSASIHQEIRKCVKLKLPHVTAWQSLNHAGHISIPNNLPPTNLGNCRIVQPRYCLELKVKTGMFGNVWFYNLLRGFIPISIGTPPPEINLDPANNTNPIGEGDASVDQSIEDAVMSIDEEGNNSANGLADPNGNQVLPFDTEKEGHDDNNDPPPTYEDALTFSVLEKTSPSDK